METRRVLMRSLAVVVVIASVIWTTTAAAGGYEKLGSKLCCTKVSSSVVNDPIIGIRLLRPSLPCVYAVIFETEKGEFCSDPKQRWVREKVKKFVKPKINKPQTSTSPPTSSTSDQTHLGGSTQATDSSSVTNV